MGILPERMETYVYRIRHSYTEVELIKTTVFIRISRSPYIQTSMRKSTLHRRGEEWRHGKQKITDCERLDRVLLDMVL